jgi:hypothetical protein
MIKLIVNKRTGKFLCKEIFFVSYGKQLPIGMRSLGKSFSLKVCLSVCLSLFVGKFADFCEKKKGWWGGWGGEPRPTLQLGEREILLTREQELPTT